ncbi:MAG: autotransporter outer membrane beta-barrel domain-containing protein [Bacteroidota bacterium]|nr:autotransporter outer membrane beta-barrel domain-containing protein [Bacteroidota bacterium]
MKALLIFLVFFCAVCATNKLFAQSDTTLKTAVGQQVPWNAGFDVIVKMNGEIVYGLVKEVGPLIIRYQRTDIPDGPVYIIPTQDVYVISYRNQVKDYLGHVPDATLNPETVQEQDEELLKKEPYPKLPFFNKNMFEHGTVQVSLGFLRSFTKVKDVSQYTSNFTFPVVMLGYEFNYSNNIRLGTQVGFGSHKFNTQQYDNYDSILNNITLKENIFGLYVYGRYYFADMKATLRPFVLGGVGITSSNILSDNIISFSNGNSQMILVKSGRRSTGFGITARVGADYNITNELKLVADAGYGLSVLNVGLLVAIK